MCHCSVSLAEAALAAAPVPGAAGIHPGPGPSPEGVRPAAVPAEGTSVGPGPASARHALAAYALGALRHVCAAHPNPRRAFAAVVGRLLVPVLARAFASSACNDVNSGSAHAADDVDPGVDKQVAAGDVALEPRLADAGLALVDAVVFAPAHVPELAGLCAVEAAAGAGFPGETLFGGHGRSPAGGPGGSLAPGKRGDVSEGGGAAGAHAGASAPRSYHWQLFQVLDRCLEVPTTCSMSSVRKSCMYS